MSASNNSRVGGCMSASKHVCVIHKMEINGADVTRLLSDTQAEAELSELIEEGWK